MAVTFFLSAGYFSRMSEQATKYLYTSDVNRSWQTAVVYPDSVDSVSQDGNGDWTVTGTDHVSTDFDRLGRKTSTTDQRGVVHSFSYDPAGRLSDDEATSLGMSGNVDDFVRCIHTEYDDLSRVQTVTSLGYNEENHPTLVRNQVEYAYDGWGNLIEEDQAHDGLVGTGTPVVQYHYGDGADENGKAAYLRLTDVVYPNTPSPRDVIYGYGDAQSNDINKVIDAIMSRLETISDSSGTLAAYKYLVSGQIVEEDDPVAKLSYLDTSGNVTGLDRFGRVVDQIWTDYSQQPATLDGYVYGYDRAGNRLWKQNVNPGASGLDELYIYDNLDRLTNTQRGTLSFSPLSITQGQYQQSWTLDGEGNFSAFNDNGSEQTRGTNAANEITSTTGIATPTYDAAGDMTSDGTLNYKYDAWNRLVEVDQASGGNALVATYQYDGQNHRVIKTLADGTRTDYYYNRQWQVVEERMLPSGENQNTVVTQYVWDQSYIDTPVVRFRDGAALYYTTDANHNVTSLIDATTGDAVEHYVYDAYGKVTFCDGDWTPLTAGGNNSTSTPGVSSAYGNEILYCGYRQDPETAVAVGSTFAAANYQDRNRELITSTSTFDIRDPIESSPNLYAYCGDDPLIYTDPTGLKQCHCTSLPKSLPGGDGFYAPQQITIDVDDSVSCEKACEARTDGGFTWRWNGPSAPKPATPPPAATPTPAPEHGPNCPYCYKWTHEPAKPIGPATFGYQHIVAEEDVAGTVPKVLLRLKCIRTQKMEQLYSCNGSLHSVVTEVISTKTVDLQGRVQGNQIFVQPLLGPSWTGGLKPTGYLIVDGKEALSICSQSF